MKAKYFESWPNRNVSKGGKRISIDEYNKEFKGDPYNLKYKKKHYRNATGYMSADVEEYHRVPEQKDMTSDSDEKNNGAAVASRAMKTASSAAKRKRMLNQVVALLAGSVIIVSSYQAMASRQDESNTDVPAATAVTDGVGDDTATDETMDSSETEATSESTEEATNADGSAAQYGGAVGATEAAQNAETSASWEWSSDHKTAYLIIKDSDGNVISKTEETVSSSKEPATCTKEGTITYTASAEYDGNTYTDTQSEKIAALGHKFDKGKEVTLDDGSTAMEFECERCGEHFTIKNSLDEE